MKILIPILGFGRTGGYRVLSQLASEWCKQGHEVDFLCPDTSAHPYFPTTGRILWVNDIGTSCSGPNPNKAVSGRYNIRALFCGLRQLDPNYDILLANQCLTAWPVTLTQCITAKKFYYIQAYEPEYYSSARTIKGTLLSLISALTYHLPLKRIANSPIYFRYKNLRCSVAIPPGMDLSIFHPPALTRDLNCADLVTIGCIGRSEPEKGLIYALHAFETLHKLDSRFRLKVAYGNLPQNWSHPQCEVVMPKNDTDLADFYRSLDVLIAPGTVQHGAPHYPVLEAGACGVAVVTTGYMGASPDTAWIVTNKDVQSIVSSVTQVVSDREIRLEKRANFLVESRKYEWNRVSRSFIDCFESL